MKIIIPGGSGQVGTLLARALSTEGHEVLILSRTVLPSAQWRTLEWDSHTVGPWLTQMDGADAVINLAGRSVNCRYTPENRRVILASRVDSTRVVGDAIRQCKTPPSVWLQASTATIYAHRYDASNDEDTGVLGGAEPDVPDTWRFSVDVARRWEAALFDSPTPATRKVALRSAMVMSPDPGGVFDILLSLVRHGLGGRNGDGRQYLSWIHGADFVRAVLFLLQDESRSDGAVNICAPEPLPNADFLRALREAWGIPFGLPSPEWMLEIGTRLLQTETELVLKSRRVVPGRLLAAGFSFRFPDWDTASRDLCAHWRAAHSVGATS